MLLLLWLVSCSYLTELIMVLDEGRYRAAWAARKIVSHLLSIKTEDASLGVRFAFGNSLVVGALTLQDKIPTFSADFVWWLRLTIDPRSSCASLLISCPLMQCTSILINLNCAFLLQKHLWFYKKPVFLIEMIYNLSTNGQFRTKKTSFQQTVSRLIFFGQNMLDRSHEVH